MIGAALLERPVYTVRAVQEDDWWVAYVQELGHIATQARRHCEIRDQARDLIACWLDVDIAGIAVTVTPPRILITGSRWWTDVATLTTVLARYRELYPDAVLVHGNCRGVDLIAAEIWQNWGLPTEAHAAAWALGNRAGPMRNTTMVGYGALICLAFPLPNSRGTRDCMAKATRARIPVATFADCVR